MILNHWFFTIFDAFFRSKDRMLPESVGGAEYQVPVTWRNSPVLDLPTGGRHSWLGPGRAGTQQVGGGELAVVRLS